MDTVAAPYAAWELIRSNSFDVSSHPKLQQFISSQFIVTPSGQWISRRPPGSTLACLPVIAPIAMFRDQAFGYETMQSLGKLASALHAGAATALFYLLCVRLTPRAAIPATLLFGLGTSVLSIASMAMWMHGPAVFWLTLALYALLTGPEEDSLRRGLAVGFAIGMSLLSRATVGVFLIATLCPLVYYCRSRSLVGIIVGTVPPVLALCAYNYIYFDAPLLGGYANEVKDSTNASLWEGLPGLTIAPSRGLLIYSPAFLLVPWGLYAIARRRMDLKPLVKWLMIAWFGGFLITLVYYARWTCWWGGWCFGPRFMCETMPILCLIVAFAIESLHETWSRTLAKSLIAVSILVQLIGIFGNSSYWEERHPNHQDFFSFRDTQIQARAEHFLRLDVDERRKRE